jgi:hypothetical protein
MKDETKEKKLYLKMPLQHNGNREGINEHHLPIQVVPTACKWSKR